MNKKNFYIIGIMSGTSLDGIDFVYVKFNKKDYTDFKILEISKMIWTRPI